MPMYAPSNPLSQLPALASMHCGGTYSDWRRPQYTKAILKHIDFSPLNLVFEVVRRARAPL